MHSKHKDDDDIEMVINMTNRNGRRVENQRIKEAQNINKKQQINEKNELIDRNRRKWGRKCRGVGKGVFFRILSGFAVDGRENVV